MKKIFITIAFLICGFLSYPQDYFVNFTGTGDTSIVNSVKVFNFTKNDSITINGGDILRLVPFLSTGNSIITSSEGQSKIYPNPMEHQSTLKFDVPNNGYVNLSLIDMGGKTICNSNIYLLTGENIFNISNVFKGTYIVRILGENFSYSNKLMSMSNCGGQPIFEYSSINPITYNKLKKSANYIEFLYDYGDILYYKGSSGIFSTVVMDSPIGVNSDININFDFVECLDIYGHFYTTIKIKPKFGEAKTTTVTQTWMAENLNNGIYIPMSEYGQSDNGILEKYVYDNDTNNAPVYGGLYTWNEMMQWNTTTNQGVCPENWHIPTFDEWVICAQNLGGTMDSATGNFEIGGNMKEMGVEHWLEPNNDATNSTGFSALPGGIFISNQTGSGGLNTNAYFWTSSSFIDYPTSAWSFTLNHLNGDLHFGGNVKFDAMSVRCVHD